MLTMATVPTDDWTEEKCLQLIREYRSRPILWDTKDPFFFKKNMKPVAWDEIGATINTCPDQCKHKMNILMSSFRREKAKIMNSIKNLKDPSAVYKSTWFAFKEMAFLLDRESERKRQLNQDSDETEDDDGNSSNIKLTLLKHHLESPASTRKRQKIHIPTKVEITQKEQQENIVPQVIQQQPTPGPSQTGEERDEEIKSFTSFIGNKMKKYSDETKNAVQQAICEIIFKADRNYYEKNYDKFTIIDEVDPLNKHIYDEDGHTLIKIQTESDTD